MQRQRYRYRSKDSQPPLYESRLVQTEYTIRLSARCRSNVNFKCLRWWRLSPYRYNFPRFLFILLLVLHYNYILSWCTMFLPKLQSCCLYLDTKFQCNVRKYNYLYLFHSLKSRITVCFINTCSVAWLF